MLHGHWYFKLSTWNNAPLENYFGFFFFPCAPESFAFLKALSLEPKISIFCVHDLAGFSGESRC